MFEPDKMVYGVKIIQDPPFRMDRETLELIPFTDADAECIRNAILELMKELAIRDWHLTEIHFK